MTRAFIGRASYTIDPNRSAAVESAVAQNLDGMYVKAEYSQARGDHWRTTVAMAVARWTRPTTSSASIAATPTSC